MSTDSAPSLGDLLRSWRTTRGRSQLDLSLAAGVSQRHLSFIESGRSTPTREKLMMVAEALDVPLRERNTLLLAAGYAPIYAEEGWDGPHMERVVAAAKRLLVQQEPFPAVLMDRYWDVLATNEAAPRFFGRFVDLSAWPKPRNLLRLMFDPQGLQPFVRDWERVSRTLLERVRREAVGRVLDGRSRELIDTLLAFAGAPDGKPPRHAGDDLPMIPIGFQKDGAVLSYFSMIATVGAPTAVAAQELRVECLFPADDATERGHLAFMKGQPHRAAPSLVSIQGKKS